MVLCAFSIFGIVVLIPIELVQRSQLTLHAFGFQFFCKTYFDSDDQSSFLLGPG